ncbi:hypothetical protein C2S51_019827 [Perilla frutescens var. frutescens]|nr:hypothetical protein C2S51_019827 [Perilla frutescens var. frutescens]
MAAPSIINHASHPQHLLFRTSRLSALTPLTCCPDDSYTHDVYRCIICDYYIHIRCATLPKRIVRHEYDEHPLHLVFDRPPNQEMIMNCFCEICEEDIDIKYWSYRCGVCDKWFHVNCIPDGGYLSKVKFGGTLSLDDHLMSLTRMLTLPTQRDHSSTSKPPMLLYSEVDDQQLCHDIKDEDDYGMMILEIAGGRKNISLGDVDHTSETYFPQYIYKQLDEMDDEGNGYLAGIISEDESQLVKDQTSMTKVVEMLEGKPYLYSPPRSALISTSTSESM